MNLFINFFNHSNPKRDKEIKFCLEKNEKNELIERIIVINRDKRCTYGDFFDSMKAYPKDINIIANADIYFDNTIEKANDIDQNECFALTRWEFINGNVITFNQRHGKPSPPEWSQDAWIFKGSIDPKDFYRVEAINLETRTVENIPFELGIPGCDNKLAAMLRERKVSVTNPSQSIRAIHVHEDNHRVYPRYQILKGIKPYGIVYQTGL